LVFTCQCIRPTRTYGCHLIGCWSVISQKNFLALNQTSAKVFGFAFIFWIDKFWNPTKQARYFYAEWISEFVAGSTVLVYQAPHLVY
jgi:hypothetical protein